MFVSILFIYCFFFMKLFAEGEILIREEIQQALHEVDKAKNEVKHYTGKLKEQEKRIEGLNSEVMTTTGNNAQ